MKFHMLAYSPCADHMAYQLFARNIKQLAFIRKYHEVDYQRMSQSVWEHSQLIHAIRNNDVISAGHDRQAAHSELQTVCSDRKL